MSRKIWKLSDINYLQLKSAHIPGRINVATDRLSRLEMSRDYYLKEQVFQFSESRPVCVKTKQASKNLCISDSEKRSRQHRQCIETGLVKNKRSHTITSSGSPNSESIIEVLRRRKNGYFNSSFFERPSMVK
jgi:hypothetical protein